MRVSKLEALLARRRARHGDVEVRITWEGKVVSFEPEHVYLANKTVDDSGEHVLILDADENFYKSDITGSVPRPMYAVDPQEGEEGS